MGPRLQPIRTLPDGGHWFTVGSLRMCQNLPLADRTFAKRSVLGTDDTLTRFSLASLARWHSGRNVWRSKEPGRYVVIPRISTHNYCRGTSDVWYVTPYLSGFGGLAVVSSEAGHTAYGKGPRSKMPCADRERRA